MLPLLPFIANESSCVTYAIRRAGRVGCVLGLSVCDGSRPLSALETDNPVPLDPHEYDIVERHEPLSPCTRRYTVYLDGALCPEPPLSALPVFSELATIARARVHGAAPRRPVYIRNGTSIYWLSRLDNGRRRLSSAFATGVQTSRQQPLL